MHEWNGGLPMSTERRNTHIHGQHPSAVGRVPDRPSRASASGHARLSGGRAEGPPASFEENATGGFSHLLRTLPLSVGLTAVLGLGCLTAAALVAHRSPDPTSVARPLALAALAVTSLVGGIIAGRRYREATVMSGLMAGGVLTVLLLLVSLITVSEGDLASPVLTWLSRLGIVLLHVLGGRLARPRTPAPAHTAGGHRTHR